jgi:Protein of unknown function (DUF2865)
MRIRTAIFAGVAMLSAVLTLTTSARAQSVFQKIFGLGGPPQPVAVPMPTNRIIIPPHRLQSRATVRTHQSRIRRDQDGEDDIGPPDSAGPYKTMCVRACDGFYFPLRHNARRKNFASDVASCRNACGSDARLFYYSLNGPQGPDAMVDLAGRKYTELPHAFAYRKALVQGCACKPVPWSTEEAARHQSYAEQDVASRAATDEPDDAGKVSAAEPAKATSRDGAAPPPIDVTRTETKPEAVQIALAADGSVDTTSAVFAATQSPKTIDVSAAPKVNPEIVTRQVRRRSRPSVQRIAIKTPVAAGGAFTSTKPKLVWPGDTQ